mgnify:CR=1 FL=1
MKIFKSSKEENQWMSISDLMSVLMIIFLFISIVYMRSVSQKNNQITFRYQKGITTHTKSRKVRCLCGFPAPCLLFKLQTDSMLYK